MFPTSPEEGEGRYVHSSWGGRELAAPGREAQGPEEFESLIFCLKAPEGEFPPACEVFCWVVSWWRLGSFSTPSLPFPFLYLLILLHFSARTFIEIFFFAGSKRSQKVKKKKKKKSNNRKDLKAGGVW